MVIATPPDTRAPTGDSPAPGIFRAPLLESVLAELPRRGRQVILDLGPARERTLDYFLSAGPNRLVVADIVDALAQGTADPAAPALLPAFGEQPPDLVLGWDLPGYVDQKVLATVLDRIAAASRGGTLLHCMVVYSARSVPRRPPHHCILPDASVSRRPRDGEEMPATSCPIGDLERLLPRFAMERSVLLRNGFQECLFRCRQPGH